jgi:threonine dehydrogenase-like Zn-dependent dehydrogenase
MFEISGKVNMAGKTMKALLKQSEGISYKYLDYPISEPGDGELLVKVFKASICGSDLNLYSWNEG